MAETLLALLAAHLVADYVLQTRWMVKSKTRPAALALHGAIIAITAAAALGGWHPVILLTLVVTHVAADFAKARLKESARTYIGDQLFHFAVVAALAAVFPGAYAAGAWPEALGAAEPLYLKALTLIAGFIATALMGGYLIRTLMAPISAQLRKEHQEGGLENGGFWIGCLERTLVFIFVLSGAPEGIGLLIAAKSILRFGEIRNGEDRKLAEYIIIGTFLSFAWSLAAAGLTRQAFLYWN